MSSGRTGSGILARNSGDKGTEPEAFRLGAYPRLRWWPGDRALLRQAWVACMPSRGPARRACQRLAALHVSRREQARAAGPEEVMDLRDPSPGRCRAPGSRARQAQLWPRCSPGPLVSTFSTAQGSSHQHLLATPPARPTLPACRPACLGRPCAWSAVLSTVLASRARSISKSCFLGVFLGGTERRSLPSGSLPDSPSPETFRKWTLGDWQSELRARSSLLSRRRLRGQASCWQGAQASLGVGGDTKLSYGSTAERIQGGWPRPGQGLVLDEQVRQTAKGQEQDAGDSLVASHHSPGGKRAECSGTCLGHALEERCGLS